MPAEHSYDIIIAAVPLMALLLVAAGLSVVALAHRPYFSTLGHLLREGKGAPVAAVAAVPVGLQSGGAVQELR